MDQTIRCTLTPGDLRARQDGLLAELVARAERIEPLPSGLRLQFTADADTLSTIVRAVDAERQCCRFLRFQISVEPDGGPIYLELDGPPGTGEFVVALLNDVGSRT